VRDLGHQPAEHTRRRRRTLKNSKTTDTTINYVSSGSALLKSSHPHRYITRDHSSYKYFCKLWEIMIIYSHLYSIKCVDSHFVALELFDDIYTKENMIVKHNKYTKNIDCLDLIYFLKVFYTVWKSMNMFDYSCKSVIIIILK